MNPYYKDDMEKYSITHSDYYRLYELNFQITTQLRMHELIWMSKWSYTDKTSANTNLHVISKLLVSDSYLYFYHWLLETCLWRSEDELLNISRTLSLHIPK